MNPTWRVRMEIYHAFILLSSTLTLAAADDVRLVDGGKRCAGRVEVLHEGRWGTLCDYYTANNAAVVCRELRCGKPERVVSRNAHDRAGSQPIWIVRVYCTGSESTLRDCETQGAGQYYCEHNKDIELVCSGQNVKLVAGPHQCAGRVEVLHEDSWSTVCDAEFDQQDAKVVCRELDCGIPAEVLGSAAFGQGMHQVWTQELQCTGNESEIYTCPTSSSLKSCSHADDVGLICSGHTEARLMNGSDCSGRVELEYLGRWGTVCAVHWDMRAADVLCAQLGCGSALAVVDVDWFGEGSGHIFADVFDCQGKEKHLSQCGVTSWRQAPCSHKDDVGVICNGSSMAFQVGRVRLSGGSKCQGKVEVYFRQDWRRVLLDSWSLNATSMLCRQLGCGPVLDYSFSRSTTEHNHLCVTGLNCSGSEAHVGNCSSAQAKPVNCSSEEQLYITCSVPNSIRLVGSGGDCAGRLEIFHNGSWGTVCDDSWDIKDAQVVCRQLRCGEALPTHIPAWFGPGSGSIWLNKVECEGNETSLWNCRFQLCEKGECGHQEDVGIVCTEFNEIRLTEGCKGNLEVFYNGTWGNVCINKMELSEANMVCRELNCGPSGNVNSPTRSRVKSAPNWLDEITCRKHDSGLLKCPSSPWGQNSCNNQNEVVQITCAENQSPGPSYGTCTAAPQKPCSNPWPLRLSGGKRSCSGRLEVFYNSTWISICDNWWNIDNARVACRQLGCGSALSADRNVPSGSDEKTFGLNRVKCRGNEIHLWDCYYSLNEHPQCSYAGVTCTDPDISSVSHTTTTTTTTTRLVRAQRDPASPGAPSTLPLLVVLGTLLFLTSGLSLVLFYRNRVLRRALSKTSDEALYEEINHMGKSKRFTRSGSLLSEEQYSGYESLDGELHPRNLEGKVEYYDDVIDPGDIIRSVEPPEDYDNAISAGAPPDGVEDYEAEAYDDAVTDHQKSVLLTDGVSENYDDAVTSGEEPKGSSDNLDNVDDVINKEKDEEYDDVEEKSQTDASRD